MDHLWVNMAQVETQVIISFTESLFSRGRMHHFQSENFPSMSKWHRISAETDAWSGVQAVRRQWKLGFWHYFPRGAAEQATWQVLCMWDPGNCVLFGIKNLFTAFSRFWLCTWWVHELCLRMYFECPVSSDNEVFYFNQHCDLIIFLCYDFFFPYFSFFIWFRFQDKKDKVEEKCHVDTKHAYNEFSRGEREVCSWEPDSLLNVERWAFISNFIALKKAMNELSTKIK